MGKGNNSVSRPQNCIICGHPMRGMFCNVEYCYYRCSQCRHMTTFPYPSQSQIEEHYAHGFRAGNYNIARIHSDVYRASVESFLTLINGYLHKNNRALENACLLDIGCFTGEFLELASKKNGADVYGVELQTEAVKIANQKLPGRIVQQDVLRGNLTLPQTRFDIITLLGVIEHVTDPVLLLQRARELLNPNGLLVLQTPNSWSFLARAMGRHWPPYAPVEHIHLFSQKSLLMALRKLGFQAVTVKRHWKVLSIKYVYEMFQTFGPVFHRILAPFYSITPDFLRNMRLPFYIGEMFVFAEFERE